MSETPEFVRTRKTTPVIKEDGLLMQALTNPVAVTRELNNRSLYHFLQYFWPVISAHTFQPNWHIEFLCSELEKIARKAAAKESRDFDLIINVPPGTSKTITVSIMFPAWCWTQWYWMRFITASYSKDLALESAEYCRDLVRSPEFQRLYPDIGIKEDKDTKSNFKIVKKIPGLSISHLPKILSGGSRFSTSVGGTLMGFHGDILIVDDPLNPQQAASEVELGVANRWMEQTLPTRKTNKAVTPTILIMQRLNQDDPAGHLLAKQKANIRHICLPGECRNYFAQVQPPEMIKFYKDDLLDINRMPWKVLHDMEADLGQYGFAGQIGQNPTPPGGGMFKVDHFQFATKFPNKRVDHTVRYWDKAGTKNAGDYTVGLKMCRLENGFYVVEDVKRGQWGTNQREDIIKQTAEADGVNVEVWVETEPGSSGKESSENTIRNLAGFVVRQEHPTGDKATRADPYSVQVNNGNVILMPGEWQKAYLDELRFFPYSTHKDQVDGSSGAFSKLVGKRIARRIT
jgi:predicted phage terminase large subunit-like protein